MKKIIALVLAVMMATVCLAACGNSSSETTTPAAETKAAEQTTASGNDQTAAAEESTEEETTVDLYADSAKEVVVGIVADPEQFIPWGGFSQGGRNIFPMLYQTLLSDVRDPDTGDIMHYHALMKSYEQTDDTHYTITLYENIYDTAGNHFTASDVCFCWDGFKQGPAGSNISGLIAYEATGDYTIECTVADTLGIGDFEEILTTTNMVTQAAYEASPDGMASNPVGTTGYVLSEYAPGSYCVVERAPGEYWNQAANDAKDIDAGYVPTSDTNNVKKVRFEFITDTNTMAIALESGKIDIATSVSTIDVPFYQSDEAYSVHQYPDNMFGLIFNCSSNSPFANENLRKAVAYSISAQDLLDTIYSGDGFKLHAFAMDYQIGYQKSWDSEDYFSQDLSKAQDYFDKYLKETNQSADKLSFKLIHMSTDPMTKYAQVVQAALIKLTGNNNVCSLQGYDSVTYGTVRQDPTAFDLAVYNALSNKTYILYNWKNCFYGYDLSAYGNNDICFTGDSKLWDLEEAAQTTLDDDAVDAFQQYLNENCYFVNYICGPAYWVGSSLVTKWALGAKNSVAICAMNYDWSVKY